MWYVTHCGLKTATKFDLKMAQQPFIQTAWNLNLKSINQGVVMCKRKTNRLRMCGNHKNVEKTFYFILLLFVIFKPRYHYTVIIENNFGLSENTVQKTGFFQSVWNLYRYNPLGKEIWMHKKKRLVHLKTETKNSPKTFLSNNLKLAFTSLWGKGTLKIDLLRMLLPETRAGNFYPKTGNFF